jgi:hypothetical protein
VDDDEDFEDEYVPRADVTSEDDDDFSGEEESEVLP